MIAQLLTFLGLYSSSSYIEKVDKVKVEEVCVDYTCGRLMKDNSSCEATIETLDGWICGVVERSYGGVEYARFRGVPYARQPVGELRFMAPQSSKRWDGFFDASFDGPACPETSAAQDPLLTPDSVGEDCLHASVSFPVADESPWLEDCQGCDCLPIIIFVHGDGFSRGFNGPEYLMDKRVVLITLNYRTGPFGFLYLNAPSMPGNAGLRDLVLALQWVRVNARMFGGHPDCITLMGHGSGASAVHILSFSQTAENLFNNAILMSGTAYSGFISLWPAYASLVSNMFLLKLGINSTCPIQIHKQLIALPTATLLDANRDLISYLGYSGFSVFNPVRESYFEGVSPILEAHKIRRETKHPLLVGYVNKECEFVRRRLQEIDILAKIDKFPLHILPSELKPLVNNTDGLEIEQMKERYFNGTPSIDKYIASCSDSIVYPVLDLAFSHALTCSCKGPMYLYRFSYNSGSVPAKLALGLNYTGAGHTDDLSYILRHAILKNKTLNADDERMKNWMTSIVANFAACSNTTCGKSQSELWPEVAFPVGYQAVRAAAHAQVNLTDEDTDMMDFWDLLHEKLPLPYH